MTKQVKTKAKKTPVKAVAPLAPSSKLPQWFTGYIIYGFIFLFSFLLYGNTLWNDYALDDAPVLLNNKFTKKGFGGIKDQFVHDLFEGAHGQQGAHSVSGGRYRPLLPVSLNIEYEIIRKIRGDKRTTISGPEVIIGEDDPYLSPVLSHFINVFLFACACALLYCFLAQIMPPAKERPAYLSLAFIATLFYAAHPIHTEAVANIKGRDEIMSMLFSLATLALSVNYIKTGKIIYMAFSMLTYFIALLSKENAITFLAIVPLTWYFFTRANIKQYAMGLGMLALPVIVFLLLRNQFVQTAITQSSVDIFMDPFVLATGTQKFATTVLTFLCYFKLLLIPHPLTHDYYYNQIPYAGPGNILFLLSLALNVGLLVYAALNFKKKTVPVYAILFYFITFSVVSNLFFTVGVLMNERFIFMSSAGFCLLAAWLLLRYVRNDNAIIACAALLLVLYTAKTYSRNPDWKNNLALLRADTKTSTGSTRVHAAFGSELTLEADRQKDTTIKNSLLDTAIVHLNEAIRIYPPNSIAWLQLGNAIYNRRHRADEAIPLYQKAADYYQGGFYEAYLNMGTVCTGENRTAEAKQYLHYASNLRPGESACKYMLAEVSAKQNQPDSVDHYFALASRLKIPAAKDYYAIGKAYGNIARNFEKAITYMQKAIELKPNEALYYEDLGVAYGLSGRYQEAINTTQKLIQLNPDYAAGYKNLYILYKVTGQTELSNTYLQKYNSMTGQAQN